MRRRLIAALLVTVLLAVGAACHKPPPANGTNIHGFSTVTVQQAQRWARSRGATQTFIDLAPIYWREATHRGLVRPEMAYAQSAKETAFGRFGGAVTTAYRNPCGLKPTAGGADHQRFPSWTTGVIACLDHLALYAGAPGYPRAGTPDPRHFPSLRDKAETVEALGGRWAPSPTYGTSLLNDYLRPMARTAP